MNKQWNRHVNQRLKENTISNVSLCCLHKRFITFSVFKAIDLLPFIHQVKSFVVSVLQINPFGFVVNHVLNTNVLAAQA